MCNKSEALLNKECKMTDEILIRLTSDEQGEILGALLYLSTRSDKSIQIYRNLINAVNKDVSSEYIKVETTNDL